LMKRHSAGARCWPVAVCHGVASLLD